MTGPDELEFAMVPKFTPANPPTMLFAPVLITGPIAVENEIMPKFPAANPPR